MDSSLYLLLSPLFDNAARALFSRMTTPPTELRKRQISQLIISLKLAGVWSKLDALYIMAAADSQAAKLNWIANQYNLTEVNAPTFTADRGFTGDGSTSYLDNGTAMNAMSGSKFVLDNASVFAWPLTNNQNSAGDAGSVSSLAPLVCARDTSDRIAVRANSGTTTNVASITDARGLVGWSRNNASTIDVAKNGSVVSAAAANVSTSVSSSAFSVGKVSTGFNNRQQSLAGFGSSLTAANWLALYTALNTYLTAVGAA